MAQFYRRPMMHFDRRELYTDLETRVRYLHSFLDFSSRDIEALISGAKYIKALIPALVNIVYKKLLQYDITARAFETRSTSYEGPVDMNLNETSPQILHRKMFLRAYLTKLCSDPSKMEYWEYLDKVGMMHVGQGRAHPLHVEYVHIGVTLSFIQDVLTEAILSHPRLKMDRKIGLVKALSKVIWIQNDLFAKWYVRDGDEFSEERLVPEIEPEGYLHGKKILRSGSDSESEIEDADMATGSCPFKNLATPVASGPRVTPKSPLSPHFKHMSLNEEMASAPKTEPADSRLSPSPVPPASPSISLSAIPRPVAGSA
ncbi:hypothetical protein DPSP01_007859 [Paraphaeosphaeria sporulosa]|uniref:Globin-sensor domain-containing protein n=1 Tax=Paraphaeosphaeria sporulosa TaxID=1460663 RepID=A0A177CJ86_9PLEO|nr:uncharacterized protein CC84DRAFT_1163532 [Paraphaeosphaeria sporulosa]OAG07321.1 hypothetical protein CC84DRAFT_1163532 [Paraphaeosphaeria sporulosa]